MIGALKKDKLLPEEYLLSENVPHTFQGVLTELIRLKEVLDVEENDFVLYFPPGLHSPGWQEWFTDLLKAPLPKGIRLATIDAEGRRTLGELPRHKKSTIIELKVPLQMISAMRNEMDKDSDDNRPHSPAGKLQKQVRRLMDATVDENMSVKEEAKKLINLGYQINTLSTKSTAHLVCATAFYGKKETEIAFEHIDKTLELTIESRDTDDQVYPMWRMAMVMKASLLSNDKKTKKKAIMCYEEVGEIALQHGDTYHVMDAYRMKAFLEFQKREMEDAWLSIMLSLQAGTNLELEMRRASSYLYSAELSVKIAEYMNKTPTEINALKDRIATYIGDDWETLLQGTETLDVEYVNRRKPITT